MNWLITGGCGFIGVNLVRRLQREGVRVRILDNLSVGTRETLACVTQFREVEPREAFSEGVQLVVGDLLDDKVCALACQDADVIVHLAANTGVGPSVEDPVQDCRSNVLGLLNVLEGARSAGVKRFVFASSGAPVGECDPPIHEEKVPRPVSPYGASKLAGEGYCSAYFRTFGIETVALRFGNVYGPFSGDKSSVVARFIRHAESGQPLEIYGDGTQTRDYVFVEDLVNAIFKAASVAGIGGEIFQIATSKESTIIELLEVLKPLMEVAFDRPVEVGHGAKRLGDVMRNFSDVSKAKAILGWEAEVGLEDGLQRTTTWFREFLEPTNTQGTRVEQ